VPVVLPASRELAMTVLEIMRATGCRKAAFVRIDLRDLRRLRLLRTAARTSSNPRRYWMPIPVRISHADMTGRNYGLAGSYQSRLRSYWLMKTGDVKLAQERSASASIPCFPLPADQPKLNA
jgi:hypothetical protein